jgi:hypothetical protein
MHRVSTAGLNVEAETLRSQVPEGRVGASAALNIADARCAIFG